MSARGVLTSILALVAGAFVGYGLRNHDFSLFLVGLALFVCGFVFVVFDGKDGEQ